MANSRSNIYPVQLQGAELNLNKFDAEIKQYSGFNKNNSPFVGGCLSNLFTKTEENTTGSSDSVYVDDNGDVYEAKTDGLYKNGEKVIEPLGFFDPARFIPVEIKELDLPDNTIFVKQLRRKNEDNQIIDDSFFYVTAKENADGTVLFSFCYKDENVDSVLGNRYFEILENDTVLPITSVKIDMPDGDYITSSNTVEIPFIIRCDAFSKMYNRVAMKGGGFALQAGNSFNIIEYPINFSLNVSLSSYINVPPVIIEETLFSFWCLYMTFDKEGHLCTTYETGSSSRTTCPGKNKYFYFNGKAYLLDVSNYTTTETQSVMIYCNLSIGDRSIFLDKDDGYASDSYPSGTTLSVKMGLISNNYDVRGCYALKFSDNKLFYGIAGDVVTNQVTLVEDENGTKHAMMYMGVYYHNRLFNNGIITGVSLGGVLLSEWNSVDGDTVQAGRTFYDYTSVLWRNVNNKKWYYARRFDGSYTTDVVPKPTLRKINNQLVLNVCNGDKNSYRLSDGKVLYFAPDWNNRIIDDGATITKSGTAITDNVGYMATSINEYKLEDNASLLLNPVPVLAYPKVSLSKLVSNISTQNYVNVYKGASSEILYSFSITLGILIDSMIVYNSNLFGLPFPINTSGNVQLSPSLFCKTERFGNDVFIKEGSNAYQLIKEGSESVMSYYLGTRIDNLEDIFILQGQYYAIIDKQIFNVQFSGGVVQNLSFVVSVENLQFCGNSAYQAYFFSKTNRCIYVFTGANILNQLQLVDKISEIYAYKYNQSTQSIILITDLGTIVSSNLGMYLIEGFTPDDVFFYDKGVVFVSDSELTYLQYYEADGFEKHNIEVETCFYGMNNETVTINDCLYFRLFSEEHEEGEVKVSATTISLKGRKTETTVFKFKASDWDALTHSVYVRYQPKEQRGLGISFSINSPFKIASLSVGSKADAILVDKVSKGAVITPSNNDEW